MITNAIKKKRRLSRLNRSDSIWGWIFISVPLLGILLFTFIPVIMSVYVSLLDWTGFSSLSKAEFVGLQNFADIFGGIYLNDFLVAVGNTFVMMLSVPIGMVLSLLLALALNKDIPGKSVYRVIYYIPCIANTVAVTILFNRLFSENGVINQIMNLFGIGPVAWLYRPGPAKAMLIILLVWKVLGYTTLLYLAGLQGVNSEYYEAADLDGANPVQKLIKITLPLIAPMTFYIIVTGVMNALQLYTEPSIMFPYTQGKGPMDGTSTVMVLLYYQYNTLHNMGSASAIAWVLAVMIMIVTALQFFVNNRRQKD